MLRRTNLSVWIPSISTLVLLSQAILLNRNSDPEAPRGLYSLKLKSHLENEASSSYTIAFEDQGDATNFCFLLESFFEDLGDFSADVVPLSIKVKS